MRRIGGGHKNLVFEAQLIKQETNQGQEYQCAANSSEIQ